MVDKASDMLARLGVDSTDMKQLQQVTFSADLQKNPLPRFTAAHPGDHAPIAPEALARAPLPQPVSALRHALRLVLLPARLAREREGGAGRPLPPGASPLPCHRHHRPLLPLPAGAAIVPSEEDGQTFSVNFASAEVFKVRASHTKERQVWVDRCVGCARAVLAELGHRLAAGLADKVQQIVFESLFVAGCDHGPPTLPHPRHWLGPAGDQVRILAWIALCLGRDPSLSPGRVYEGWRLRGPGRQARGLLRRHRGGRRPGHAD
jgi:hypothetical protein